MTTKNLDPITNKAVKRKTHMKYIAVYLGKYIIYFYVAQMLLALICFAETVFLFLIVVMDDDDDSCLLDLIG